MATLLLNSGILYGTTTSGGNDRCGTVFAVPTDGGAFTVLHPFDAADGAYPEAGLILVGDQLFGTTSAGGAESYAPFSA